MPRIFFSSGEASGDLNAAGVIRALRAREGVEVSAMGGPRMAEAGARIVQPIDDLQVIGGVEVLAKLGAVRRALARVEAAVRAEKPDVLVLVDYPDFNMRLAARLRDTGIPVVYFIVPQVWAWRSGRVKTLARLVRRALVLFDFEVDYYRAAGIDTVHVGHPLMDHMDLSEGAPRLGPAELPAGEGPVLALLPGSRPHEIARLIGVFLESARIARDKIPGLRVAVGAAAGAEEIIAPRVKASGVEAAVVCGRTYELLRSADLAICASGTVTLEAALIGTPMIVCYRLAGISYLLARMLIHLPCVSLANVVAGEPVAPEFIQGDCRAEKVGAAAAALLRRPEALAAMKAKLLRTRERVGGPGASERAAKEISNL
jgi:lipid-A-disaccharide synthase